MFEHTEESANSLGDWMMRGAITLIFLLAGADKFGSGWVRFFEEIGVGQWFRYFTGIVEIVGGALVMIPGTLSIGITLLACTMASAVLILVFVVHRPADCVFAGALLIALALFWWNRKAATG